VNARGAFMNYEYKEKEKKNRNQFVSIRDKGENPLLEVERKGNQIEIVTYWRNEKTTKFAMPVDLFEKEVQSNGSRLMQCVSALNGTFVQKTI